MLIREEQPADRAAVAAVIEAAFARPDEAELVQRLRADGSSEIALVAAMEGAIVGHVMFSRPFARWGWRRWPSRPLIRAAVSEAGWSPKASSGLARVAGKACS